MREYHRKSCAITKDVKAQVKAIMQSYERLRREKTNILYGSSAPDGSPRSSDIGKPTEQRAIKLAYIDSRLEAIDQTAMLFRGALSGKVEDDFDPIKAYWNYDYYNYKHIRTKTDDAGPVYRTWLRYIEQSPRGATQVASFQFP